MTATLQYKLTVGRVVLSVCLGLFFGVPVYAQQAQYEALIDALDELEEAATELANKHSEIEAHERTTGGQDPWTIGRGFAKRYNDKLSELKQEETALQTQVDRARKKVQTARKSFQRALEPRTRLYRYALEKYRQIQQDPSFEPSNKRRALATIANDLNKLNGPILDKQLKMVDHLMQGIRTARGLEEAKERMLGLVENDADKVFADALIDVLNDILRDQIPQDHILRELDKKLGGVTKALKAYRIINGGTSDPLGNEDIERLINTVDLASDLIPCSLLPVQHYIKAQKYMVERIYAIYKRLSVAEAHNNLEGLYANLVINPDRIRGDLWDRVNPNVLFGTIPPEPALSTDKNEYRPGDKIRVDFEGSWTWYKQKGWIGIIPANVPHGSEDENDKYDLDHKYPDRRYGTMTFTAPNKAGSYDVRMHDTDDDGREVASVSFEVIKDCGTQIGDLSGSWSGSGWGTVVLNRTGPNSYAGTYTDTYGGLGKLRLSLTGLTGSGRWWEERKGDARRRGGELYEVEMCPRDGTITGKWNTTNYDYGHFVEEASFKWRKQ